MKPIFFNLTQKIDNQYEVRIHPSFTSHSLMPFYEIDDFILLFSDDLCGYMQEAIIFDASSDSPIIIYFQKNNGTFNSRIQSPNLLNVSSVLMHDMDGDDRQNIVLANGSCRYKPDELNATIHIFFQKDYHTFLSKIIRFSNCKSDSLAQAGVNDLDLQGSTCIVDLYRSKDTMSTTDNGIDFIYYRRYTHLDSDGSQQQLSLKIVLPSNSYNHTGIRKTKSDV